MQEILNYNRELIGLKPVTLYTINPEYYYSKLPNSIKDILINKKYEVLNCGPKTEKIMINRSAIFYTGGLESTISSVTHDGKATFYYVENLSRFCHSKGIEIVESFLMAITNLLDCGIAVIGSEYTPEDESIGKLYEFSNFFVESFSNYLGITTFMPVRWIDKFHLFVEATRRGFKFKSCDSDPPCKECFKCFQVATFNRAIGIEDTVKESFKVMLNIFMDQHNCYLQSKKDSFYGDNYSFTQIGKTLEDIWEDVC